jgi:hypothetical protein
MRKQIEESTAESARQAEAQWREARRSPSLGPLEVSPSIHLKPVSGGVEIVARYITQVAEREEVRAKLYHTAVELLGAIALPSKSDADAFFVPERLFSEATSKISRQRLDEERSGLAVGGAR